MAGVGAAAAAAVVGARGCCCGGCCGCGCPKDFQKVLELKDLGLVIYRHTARTEERNKVSGVLESATDTTEDVFILLNTKSTEMTSAQYLPGIETTKINCPRCRQLAEQVHDMLQRAPNIERKPAFGICDRCLMRGDSCYNCQRILDKFLSKRREVSDGTKTLIRQWLSKIQHIIEDITGLEERRYGPGGTGAGGRGRGAGAGAGGATLHSERIRASSELYIDQIFMRSRKDTRQLDIKPLFRPRVIRLDERGQFVEDRSRFQGSDVSRMFDLSGETGTRRDEREYEYEREHDGRGPRHRQHDALADDLWTRRSHSQESFREAARRDSDRFQEGGYRRAGDRRYFIESDDIKSQRLRDQGEVSETYARGDAHYKQLRSLAPTRKGTRVDTSADSDLAQGDDRSLYDVGKGRGRQGTPVEVTSGKGERAERKQDERYMEHDTKDRLKKETEEQKLRDKYESGRTKTDKGELSQQDQHKFKSDKDKSAKDKIELEQKGKGEREYSTKGGQEQRHKGEKEYSTKDKGGQEQRHKGEKEYSTKDKGGQEPKQKGEKEYGTKDKGGQEPKQKGEKEYGTKDKGGQVPKQKGEKEYGTKDKGGQEPKKKGEKELSTKDKGGQEPKQKADKEYSAKDKGGQEPKKKGENELGTKDKGGQDLKQKGDKEYGTKDKGLEQKQKGEKELSTKEKTTQVPALKGEKELSSKDKGGQEPKQKGEKELSSKDKGGEEQKQKGEKELSTKDKGGEEHKKKGEKELSTKDKGGDEQKKKGEKELSTKDKDGEEQKQKGKSGQELQQKGKTEKDKRVSDIKQKEKVGKESNIKDKEASERNEKSKGEKEGEITQDTKSKGTGDKDIGESGKGEKESDSKTKGGTDTKSKGKGEKEGDTKESDKKSKQNEIGGKDKGKQKKPSALTILTEQKKKETKFKDYTGPKDIGEKRKGRKDEDEAEDLIPKDRKTGKKREESKKGEDKKDKQVKKKASTAEEKEIAVNKIRVRRPSPDDTILNMVKLKLAEIPARALNEPGMKVNLEQIILDHFDLKHEGEDIHLTCPFCCDSDYGVDTLAPPKEADFAEVIIGAKVFKYKPPLLPHIEHPHEQQDSKAVVPSQFKSTYEIENIVQLVAPPEEEVPPSPPPVLLPEKKGDKKSGKQSKAQETEPICTKGITHFQLSDRSFIEKGWTMLPTEKIVRKMNVYRMRPAQPEFNWFEHNRRKRLMKYESGERLAEFDDAGHGRWYYRNGRLALDYYDAEGLNAQQRFVIYSSGEPDERGRAHPYTILATFDYLGNGIVFDHTGKIRLKYNQTEGIVLDRNIGPVSHWKWHSLNDPPVLAQVMIDTQEPDLDPRLVELGARAGAGGDADGAGAGRPQQPDNDDMLAIEFDNFVRAKSEKLTQAFKPFQIKMKALKINEYFSLRVLDQATVYLIYRDGTTNLKLNLGMVLDHHEIVDTDMADMGEVPSELERYPARTESIAALQRGVRATQRWERVREARDRRLHPTLPLPPASADRLAAAATAPRPYGPPAAAPSSPAPAPCRCSRRPTGPSLYYDNRIF